MNTTPEPEQQFDDVEAVETFKVRRPFHVHRAIRAFWWTRNLGVRRDAPGEIVVEGGRS